METFDMDATNGFLDSKGYHLYCSVQRCNSALRVLNAATDEQVNKAPIGLDIKNTITIVSRTTIAITFTLPQDIPEKLPSDQL